MSICELLIPHSDGTKCDDVQMIRVEVSEFDAVTGYQCCHSATKLMASYL